MNDGPLVPEKNAIGQYKTDFLTFFSETVELKKNITYLFQMLAAQCAFCNLLGFYCVCSSYIKVGFVMVQMHVYVTLEKWDIVVKVVNCILVGIYAAH